MSICQWLEGHDIDSLVVNGQRKCTTSTPSSLVKGYRFVNKKRICFRIPCSWSSKKIYILLYYYHTLLFMYHHLKAAGTFCWVII